MEPVARALWLIDMEWQRPAAHKVPNNEAQIAIL